MWFCSICILICGIAVLQNQAVCGIWKFSGNFNAVCSFVALFCAVVICISVQFAVFVHHYAPPPPYLGFKVTVLSRFNLPNFPVDRGGGGGGHHREIFPEGSRDA